MWRFGRQTFYIGSIEGQNVKMVLKMSLALNEQKQVTALHSNSSATSEHAPLLIDTVSTTSNGPS